MHTLTISSETPNPIQVPGGRLLKPGTSYLCTNAFAGMMLTQRQQVPVWGGSELPLNQLIQVQPFKEEKFNLNLDYNGKTICLLRGGGFGDLLMLTPLIRELKNRWSTCEIHVA